MITRRKFLKHALVTGAGLPLLMAGCGSHGPDKLKHNARVVVIGIDGLDPALIRQMIMAGELPHFARLADTGTFSPLATSIPPQSPVAWSSIATGQNPGRHGMFDFLVRDTATYLPELSVPRYNKGIFPTSDFTNPRKSPAMWELLSRADITSTVIRWPVTFPPADIKGEILAGLGVPDIKGELGAYTYYTSRTPEENEPGRENLMPVTLVDRKTKTVITGPLVKEATATRPATIPLQIRVLPSGKEVELTIQGQTWRLAEKNWSPWIRLKFKVNILQTMSGLCRFYLNRADSPLGLYLSPIQVDPADPCYPISQPGSYAADLRNRIGDYHTLGIPEDTKALIEHRLDDEAFLELCDTIMTEQEAMFNQGWKNFNTGLFACVFFTTDRIQHIYRAAQDPTHPAYDAAYARKYGDVIKQYYRRMDHTLAGLLKKIDPETLLLICSDHGFTSFKKAVHLNSWLVKNGFMRLHTTPSPLDSAGGPLFSYVDWEKTAAYSVGLNGLYLNLKGREKEGKIDPSAASQVLRQIKKELEQQQDPENGQQIVLSAYPASAIYKGPMTDSAPDLVIGFNKGYRMSWQSALGGTPADILEKNTSKWTGDHCVDPSLVPGVLFSNKKLNATGCRVIDIAPTVLNYFGLAAPMDGRSLLRPNVAEGFSPPSYLEG